MGKFFFFGSISVKTPKKIYIFKKILKFDYGSCHVSLSDVCRRQKKIFPAFADVAKFVGKV